MAKLSPNPGKAKNKLNVDHGFGDGSLKESGAIADKLKGGDHPGKATRPAAAKGL